MMSVLDPETPAERAERLWGWAKEVAAELKTKDAPRYLVRRYGLLRAYTAELRTMCVHMPGATFSLRELNDMDHEALQNIDQLMRDLGHDSLSRPRPAAGLKAKMQTQTKKLQTPWGVAQWIEEKALGIMQVSTAGHGGYKLDRQRNAQVHQAWRRKGGWYEEDCEWAIVVFTFRALYTEDQVNLAIDALKNWFPDAYVLVTGGTIPLEESLKLRERKAHKDAEGKLQSYAAWGSWHPRVPEGMVGLAVKVDAAFGPGTGPTRYFLVPSDEYAKRDIVFVVDPERHEEIAPIS